MPSENTGILTLRKNVMLNPIERFRVAILHPNRDWNH